jgi:hypothetical protein
LVLVVALAQKERILSTYASLQFNATLYDINARNNPWGTGLGLHSIVNNRSRFKPALEITGDIYIGGTKDLYLVEGRDVAVTSMVNVFAGANLQASERTYVSLLMGPSFVNGNACFGLKPAVGFYFSRKKTWMGKIAFINIFNREPSIERDFGSLSISLAGKLF